MEGNALFQLRKDGMHCVMSQCRTINPSCPQWRASQNVNVLDCRTFNAHLILGLMECPDGISPCLLQVEGAVRSFCPAEFSICRQNSYRPLFNLKRIQSSTGMLFELAVHHYDPDPGCFYQLVRVMEFG